MRTFDPSSVIARRFLIVCSHAQLRGYGLHLLRDDALLGNVEFPLMRFYPRKYLVFIFDGDSTGAHHFQHAKPNLCLEYRAPDTLCFLQCVGRCNGAVDILQLREQGLNRVGVDHLGTSGVSFAPLLFYVVPTHLMFIRPRATPRSGRARMTPLLALLCAVVLARLLYLRVRRRISLPTVIAYRRVIARRTVICNRRSIAPATVISSETVNRSAHRQ